MKTSRLFLCQNGGETYAIYTKCGILCCFLILLPILNFYLHIFQKNYMQIVLVISCFLHIMCYNYVQKGWCCMRKFDYSFLNNGLLPASLVNLTSNIAVLKTMAGVRKDEYTHLYRIRICGKGSIH